MHLFRDKGGSTPVHPPPWTKDPRLSPLDLPELLERILSFLDDYTLITITRRVCSQWHTITKRILHSTVALDVSLDQKGRDAIVAIIPQATRLIIGASGGTFQTNMDLEHIRLPAVFASKAAHSMPIRELVLSRGFSTMHTLDSFLPSSKSLTQLTLHRDSSISMQIDLGTLLQAYPHLVDLELFSLAPGGYYVLENDERFLTAQAIPTQTRLRSIQFSGVSIPLLTLQTLLSATPATTLKDLCLWRLQIRPAHSTPLGSILTFSQSSTRFVESDLDTLPAFLIQQGFTLRSFALSVDGEKPSDILAKAMERDKILESFGPRIQTWGFSTKFCSSLATLPFNFNRITTLELIPEYTLHGGLGHVLNSYLRRPAALRLIHLKARDVWFSTLLMDLGDRCPSLIPGVPNAPFPWFCSGLQTLRLSFRSSSFPTQFGKMHSRIVFGYLVRVCPQLKELEIGNLMDFTFGLEDGIVILSRLKDLEKMTLWVSYGQNREKAMERIWAVVRQGPLDWARQTLTVKTWQAKMAIEAEEFEAKRDSGDNGIDSQTEESIPRWMDTQYVGTLTDVKMALDDLNKDQYLETFWPALRDIEIRYAWINTQGVDRRTIHSRRPFRFSDKNNPVLISPSS